MEEEWTDTNAEIEQILTEFPGARGLADLIQATNLEDFRQVAQQIDQKVKAITRNSDNQPSTTPRNPKPKNEPVSLQDAIQSRSWPDYLKAKWDSQNEENN